MTAGLVVGDVKIEGSRFNGREPDERRWNIETGPLDSTALRLSWNPNANLSLQASWARLIEPEQLEPGENSTRWSASAIYTRPVGANGWWSKTLAWGRRSGDHDQFDAVALESAVGLGLWTFYGRAEYAETNELVAGPGGHHGPTFNVGKVSLGAIRDFRLGPNVRLGLGAQYARNFMPDGLARFMGASRAARWPSSGCAWNEEARMKVTRRTLLAALAAGVAMPARAQAGPVIDVVKTPACGCCNGWIAHMRGAGFQVRVRDVPDTAPFARRLGVPDDLRSCHTASVGGYAIEGHVPAADVRRLLRERPQAAGIAVPGMPAGSPGMETIGRPPPYQTILFTRAGRRTLFARH